MTVIEEFANFDNLVESPMSRDLSVEISRISFDTTTREARFALTIGGASRSEMTMVTDDGTEQKVFESLDQTVDETTRRRIAMKAAVVDAVRGRVAAMLRARSALERI